MITVTRSTFPAAAAALALAGCNLSGAEAPWLTMPSPDAHSTFFPIGKGAVHDVTGGTISCDGCHSPQAPTFKQFECVGCHTDAKTTPFHAGVSGYQWSSASCYGCHPQGTASSVNHGAIFPIRGGTKHDAVLCSQCHVDPANRKNVDCATCHTQLAVASKHGAVVDYPQHANTAGCLRCHADGQVNRIASHGDPGITGARHQPWCLICHPGMRTDKPWGADWQSRSCTPCHSSNNPG